MERPVPQHFFTIRGRDRIENDPDGTYLPDLAAALSYAESTIRELRKKSGWNDPGAALHPTPALPPESGHQLSGKA